MNCLGCGTTCYLQIDTPDGFKCLECHPDTRVNEEAALASSGS